MKTPNRKSVAVVMPIRNEEHSVRASLDSIFASTRLPDEIVVADGLSTDASLAAVEEYADRGVTIRVVSNPSIWAGGGRNAAVHATQCDIIVLCDFGNTIEPGYIEAIVRPFEEDDSIAIVAGMFRMKATSDFEHCVASIHYFEDYTLDRLSDEEIRRLMPAVVFPGGLCTAVTRAMWIAVDGQPKWLAKGQDKMFSRKVYAMGGKGAVATGARLWHHVRGTPKDLFRQLFFYGRGNGQMRFVSKHAIRLMGIYGTFAVLFALGWYSMVFPLIGAALLLAYAWVAGVRKVVRVDGSLRKLRYIPLAVGVLLIRDISSLLGHALGWAEWILVPRYRNSYRRYMAGLPDARIPLVAPQLSGHGLFGRIRRVIGVA